VSAEAAAGRWRPRWLLAVLALSLLLNIFFVSGVLWARFHDRGHGPGAIARFERVAHDLSLNGTQRTAFDRFVTTLEERTRGMRGTSRMLIDQAWDELAKPQPDQAALDRIFTEAAQSRHAYMADTSAALRGFLDTLSPEQRKRFVDLARRRPERRSGLSQLRHLGP
jgi:uncharacterized membrane protein